MRQKAHYTEEQPLVLYQLVNSARADVIVNVFAGEEEMLIDPEGKTQTMFAYETNSFSVNPNEVTKEMVENDIKKHLDYEKTEVETLEQKVYRLEEENKLLTECIVELSEVVFNGQCNRNIVGKTYQKRRKDIRGST